MSPPYPHILSILDPTSLFGRELVERIAKALPELRCRYFHTGGEAEHLVVDVAGEPALASPLAEMDELDGSFAVTVAAPPPAELTAPLLAWLRAHPEVRLLDCTQPGIAGNEARCVHSTPHGTRGPRSWYHLADPALAGPLRLLAALAPLEPEETHLTLVGPASAFGAEAVDELAAQAAARLSGQEPRATEHLPGTLAFDLRPAPGERPAALESQLWELVPAVASRVQCADAGVFHGDLAAVRVRCARESTLEQVRSLLRAGGGLRLARRNEQISVSAAVDRDEVLCSDVRAGGRWVSAWTVADGLRIGGASAAVDVLAALLAS